MKRLTCTMIFGGIFLAANGLQYAFGWVNTINLSGIAVSALIGGLAAPYLLTRR